MHPLVDAEGRLNNITVYTPIFHCSAYIKRSLEKLPETCGCLCLEERGVILDVLVLATSLPMFISPVPFTTYLEGT